MEKLHRFTFQQLFRRVGSIGTSIPIVLAVVFMVLPPSLYLPSNIGAYPGSSAFAQNFNCPEGTKYVMIGNQDGQCLPEEEYNKALCADFEDTQEFLTVLAGIGSILAIFPPTMGLGWGIILVATAINIGIEFGDDMCDNPMDE